MATVIGTAIGVVWARKDPAGSATDTMRIATGTFVGLTVGADAAGRLAGPTDVSGSARDAAPG